MLVCADASESKNHTSVSYLSKVLALTASTWRHHKTCQSLRFLFFCRCDALTHGVTLNQEECQHSLRSDLFFRFKFFPRTLQLWLPSAVFITYSPFFWLVESRARSHLYIIATSSLLSPDYSRQIWKFWLNRGGCIKMMIMTCLWEC